MTLSLSRRAIIAVTAGVSSLGLLGGSALAYNVYYAQRIVPGVTVMGEKPQVATADELRALLQQRVDAATMTLSVEGVEHVASAHDLGVTADIDAAVARALEPSASLKGRMSTPFTGWDVQLAASVDETTLRAFADSLVEGSDTQMKNASVSFDANSARFTVTPSRPGKSIDLGSLKEAANTLAASLESGSTTITITEEQPAITTEQAQKFADAAHQLLATNISITDGIDTFTASMADKSTWVKIPSAGDTLDQPHIDSAKVIEWVTKTAKATNVEPVAGVNNVNSRGAVVSVHEAGQSGWTVTNADAVAKEVEAAFSTGTDYHGDFDYDEAKPSMTTRLIADGDKTHIYAAAPGEKWIDIDLSSNAVSAYEGGTIVYGPIYMVPGAPETPTVTGKFRVWHQNPLQTMRGFNADGTKYETPNVPWATYFHGDFALHGAPWRSSFGWSGEGGSHGCVNMPVDGARWIYEWSDIGTVVVSHY